MHETAELETCVKHWAERASGRCDACGEAFCSPCLVPPLKPGKPTLCIECALEAGGVRSKGNRRGGGIESMNRARATRFF
jgi:hypothetical protein